MLELIAGVLCFGLVFSIFALFDRYLKIIFIADDVKRIADDVKRIADKQDNIEKTKRS